MDIIVSEVGVDSAFKDMRMLGRSLKCNSNKFLKSHFKDAAYDNCVDFFNSVLRNDAVAAAIATRSRGGKSFRASKSICNIRRWLDLWAEFHQELNFPSIQGWDCIIYTEWNNATHLKGILAIGGDTHHQLFNHIPYP